MDLGHAPSLKQGVKFREEPDGGLLYFNWSYWQANKTGSDILTFCDGKNTVVDILIKMSAKYETNAVQLETDITSFLQSLKNAGLLE